MLKESNFYDSKLPSVDTPLGGKLPFENVRWLDGCKLT